MDEFMTQRDAAAYLGISRERVQQFLRTGALRTREPIANVVLVRRDEVEALKQARADRKTARARAQGDEGAT